MLTLLGIPSLIIQVNKKKKSLHFPFFLQVEKSRNLFFRFVRNLYAILYEISSSILLSISSGIIYDINARQRNSEDLKM